jgi:cytochrome P450
VLTDGSTGNKWRRNRRLLTPAFHFQILENFFDVFNKNAEILCEQLDEAIENSKNIEEIVQSEIDVFPFLKRCTLDIICGNVFVTHRFSVLFSSLVVQPKIINAKNLFSFTQS